MKEQQTLDRSLRSLLDFFVFSFYIGSDRELIACLTNTQDS